MAAMYASDQWPAAQRWADRWAANDAAYERALLRGFAAQPDVQCGAMTLGEAERWALPALAPGMHREFPMAGLEGADVRQRPIHGADLAAASFATDWVDGWLSDLQRHVLPDAPTPAAHHCVRVAGVELLRWLGNHLAEMPEGAGGPDAALRCVRRAWPQIASGAVSRVQSDSVRRLWLGTCANGYQHGRTVGVVQWVARGHTIEQARGVPAMAMSWAVAIDQADPVVARLSRDDLRQRQKGTRRRATRLLATHVESQLRVEVVRPQRRSRAAAA